MSYYLTIPTVEGLRAYDIVIDEIIEQDGMRIVNGRMDTAMIDYGSIIYVCLVDRGAHVTAEVLPDPVAAAIALADSESGMAGGVGWIRGSAWSLPLTDAVRTWLPPELRTVGATLTGEPCGPGYRRLPDGEDLDVERGAVDAAGVVRRRPRHGAPGRTIGGRDMSDETPDPKIAGDIPWCQSACHLCVTFDDAATKLYKCKLYGHLIPSESVYEVGLTAVCLPSVAGHRARIAELEAGDAARTRSPVALDGTGIDVLDDLLDAFSGADRVNDDRDVAINHAAASVADFIKEQDREDATRPRFLIAFLIGSACHHDLHDVVDHVAESAASVAEIVNHSGLGDKGGPEAVSVLRLEDWAPFRVDADDLPLAEEHFESIGRDGDGRRQADD